MASKYAKAFTVPPGFPDLLRDLTRELLREYPREHEPQPKDQEYWLLDRAARYFGSRKAMAGAAAHGPNMHDLEARITTIFREADKDSNGVLDHKEFKSVSAPLRPPPLLCPDCAGLGVGPVVSLEVRGFEPRSPLHAHAGAPEWPRRPSRDENLHGPRQLGHRRLCAPSARSWGSP